MAMNKKLVLEYLVANITTLTTSNAEMADKIKTSLAKVGSFSNNSTFCRRICLMIIWADLHDANRQGVATIYFFLTVSWKCGIRLTNALNLPGILHNVHWYGWVDCYGVGVDNIVEKYFNKSLLIDKLLVLPPPVTCISILHNITLMTPELSIQVLAIFTLQKRHRSKSLKPLRPNCTLVPPPTKCNFLLAQVLWH